MKRLIIALGLAVLLSLALVVPASAQSVGPSGNHCQVLHNGAGNNGQAHTQILEHDHGVTRAACP